MASSTSVVIIMNVFLHLVESSNRYWLYDRRVNNWTEMNQDGTVPQDIWRQGKNVKVVVHGYNSNLASIMDLLEAHKMNVLAKEYAKYDNNLNIIAADWAELAGIPLPLYLKAVENVKPAGEDIAEFFVTLVRSGAIPKLRHIHFLGISMGAHVAGATGYEIEKLTGGDKLGRITGLDPAGPGFTSWDGKKPDDMTIVLDADDAEFVDIIHTNANAGNPYDTPITGKLGSNLQAGHIDFYPNGGELQLEQCGMLKDRKDFCSHQVCVLFFAYALRNPKKYIACPCDDYIKFLKGECDCSYHGTGQPIGELTKPAQKGRYYLTIRDQISLDTFQ